MKLIVRSLFIVIVLLWSVSCKKDIIEKVPKSKPYSISSQHMQKDYNFYVLYPNYFDNTLNYRVLILLDANDYFIEMADVLKSDFNNQFVLVGVMYNEFDERVNDFTYPYSEDFPNSGQADQYIQFLSYELLPYLKNELGIKPSDKTLLGHSLSGYFATYIQFQQVHENPFDNIISASPSLWWKDGYVFGLEEQFAENNSTLGTKYITTIGDLEGAMMNTHFNAFVKKIATRNYPSTAFQFMRYENMSHRNSPIVSFKDGLKFIY
ncbi:MAG: alpha/beta hydrolase-fold protein [Brumimicrobium sp.]